MRHTGRFSTGAALLLGLGLWAGAPAAAQTAATPAPDNKEAGATATSTAPAPPAPAATAPAADKTADKPAAKPAPWNGFTLSSSDGSFKARLGGLVQADARYYRNDSTSALTDTLMLRRVYLTAQGEVGRNFSFFVNTDFGDGKAGVEDAYGDLRLFGKVRLRVGKVKSPFGLEHLQGTSTLHLIERGLATQLSPNRDIGLMLTGEVAEGIVAFSLGGFNGTNDGASLDRDTNDAKDAVGRLFVRPFRKRKNAVDLGLGLAGSYGTHEGSLPSYKTGGQLQFFSYAKGVTAEGTRRRLGPQAFAYYQRAGLLAEWTRSSQAVRKEAVAERLGHTAWGVTGSLVLTGEKASYAGVKPRRPFDPSAHAWGALELVARVGQLELDGLTFDKQLADSATSARRARALGFGLNWHLTEQFKWAVNYERTTFLGGAAAGGDRTDENALFLRAQVVF